MTVGRDLRLLGIINVRLDHLGVRLMTLNISVLGRLVTLFLTATDGRGLNRGILILSSLRNDRNDRTADTGRGCSARLWSYFLLLYLLFWYLFCLLYQSSRNIRRQMARGLLSRISSQRKLRNRRNSTLIIVLRLSRRVSRLIMNVSVFQIQGRRRPFRLLNITCNTYRFCRRFVLSRRLLLNEVENGCRFS